MMTKQIPDTVDYRVRLWPTPWRITPAGRRLPPLPFDWIPGLDAHGKLHVSNTSTGHFAILHPRQIVGFIREPDHGGLKQGVLVLNTQLALSGRNVFYWPRAARRLRRRTTH